MCIKNLTGTLISEQKPHAYPYWVPFPSQEQKINQTAEAMYDFFISRVRTNLHIASWSSVRL